MTEYMLVGWRTWQVAEHQMCDSKWCTIYDTDTPYRFPGLKWEPIFVKRHVLVTPKDNQSII